MIEIPIDFAMQMQGFTIQPNQFNSVVTLDGRHVTHINAMSEFPEQFASLQATGWEPVTLTLTIEDFPPSPLLPEVMGE